MKRTLIIFALILGSPVVGFATTRPFRLDPARPMTQYVTAAWRDSTGLPADSVVATAQTRDGYLWLGTEHGLARFDGVRFTVFNRENTPALRSNEVSALLVSRDGTLWVGTNGGGALKFSGKQFTRVPVKLRYIVGFAEAPDGAIWIGAPGGVVRIRGSVYKLFSKKEGYAGGRLAAVAADGEAVYLGMPEGIVRLDDKGSRTWTTADGLSAGGITALSWTARGLLAGTDTGAVDRLVGDRFENVFRSSEGQAISSILEGESESLWMSTTGAGILRYAGGKIAQLTERDGLTSSSVNHLSEDDEGNLWASMTGGGLVCLKEGKVTTVVPPKPLVGEWILPLTQAVDGSIWFVTNGGGVNRMHGESLTRFTTANGLASNVVVALTPDRDGSVWIASDFAVQRMTSTRIVQTLTKQHGLEGRIMAMTAARDGSLWVSTMTGVHHVVAGAVQKMPWKEDRIRGPVIGIREAADGSLWLARVRGVDHLVDGKVMRFGREDGLLTNRIASITVDEKDGSLWVAAIDGLSRIRDGRVRTYRAKDGLLGDSVYGLVQDLDGNFWIPTSRGLFTMKRSVVERFDAGELDRLPIVVFRKSDGLRSSDFTGGMDRPGFRAFDGNLWFPTTRGLVLVDPERLKPSTSDPRVRIESISANSEKRQFDIAYTAPSFDSPEAMTFRYKLEGFEDTWNEVGSRRTAFYTNLPPGKYRFVVQAMTAEGRNAQVTTPVEVVPHFYETWLFRIACGLAVVLLALVLHRRRIDAVQQHQDDLRKSEEHFRSLIENASDMILVVGVDDAIRYASPSVARALGFGAKAMTRRFLTDFLIHPESGDGFLAAVRAKGTDAATLFFRDDTGQRREVEVVGAMYGEDSRVILNCRDVTERRKLEAQLEQATRLAGLGRLAATVSHEFNNVLMGIQPFIDLIRRKADDPVILRATTQMAQSVTRGKRISEEILRFTRPVDPTVRPIPVRSWLVDLETEIRSLVGPDVRLAIVAPNGLTLAGDIAQLNQVLTNLAINARDAGATSVRLEAEAVEGDGVYSFGIILEPERFAHIRFSDNGSGISDAVLPKIFEPLFTTKLTKGTGLGLAVAHQVVARHGGELFVESRVGAGTTFHLFLPIAVSDAGELLAGEETVAPSDTPSCRILLVEDDAIVAEGVMALLEDRGFHVDLAPSGGEALTLIPRCAPDVIVLDVGLPDIDGIQLYGLIMRKWPRLPVIFSTGHGDLASLETGLPAPHPQCLLKPYTVDTLIAAIASATERDRNVA